MPARPALAANCSALGNGWRPPTSGGHGQIGEVGVEIEVRGARNVAGEIARAGRGRIGEVVAAVGEAHVHGPSLASEIRVEPSGLGC